MVIVQLVGGEGGHICGQPSGGPDAQTRPSGHHVNKHHESATNSCHSLGFELTERLAAWT